MEENIQSYPDQVGFSLVDLIMFWYRRYIIPHLFSFER
jgi:hypothetical protein